MKKLFVLLLALVMVLALTSCGGTQPTTAGETSTNGAEMTTAGEMTTAAPAAGDVKTGLAVVTSVSKSKDAGENDGLAQADSIVVGVLVDADGRILECVIDAVQTKVNFDKAGKVVTAKDMVFGSKTDLGDAYGMKQASSIGKEWYQEAQALADYVVGKTVEEVKGIAVDDKGVPTDADLASSVTIKIGGFVDAIEKAVKNATVLGAKAGDKLGIGTKTTIDKSADATAEKEGLVQAYSFYVLASFQGETVTSAIIDSTQAKVNFDTTGKITSDLQATVATKLELGDAYGMKQASKLGKEWNEQALAFAYYVSGKTVEEVKGTALSETGAPAGDDLNTTVSIKVKPLIETLVKAYEYQK